MRTKLSTPAPVVLSVSSNGSEWVKLAQLVKEMRDAQTFSILKRIGVGETPVILGQ